MKIAIAKELFSSGVFRNALLIEHKGGGWVLSLYRKNNNGLEMLTNDKGETRVFKSIEAALNVSESIGFPVLDVARKPPNAPRY
jgi:hypothetical protein